MLRAMGTVCLLFLLSVSPGYGANKKEEAQSPSSVYVLSKVQKVISPRLNELGKIIEVKKANGEFFEQTGRKMYRLYYRAAAKFGSGWYWHTKIRKFNPSAEPKGELTRDSQPIPDSPWESFQTVKLDRIPDGSIYVEEGNVAFKLTDNGWVIMDESLKLSRYGYCPESLAKQSKQCYKALGWDKE